MRGGNHSKISTDTALGFARLIESFCLMQYPGMSVTRDKHTNLDKLIEGIKADLRGKGEADMDKDHETLVNMYDHLRNRYVAYASDDDIADRVLELLDAEITHEDNTAAHN